MNPLLFASSSIVGIILICISFYFYSEDLLPLYIITYIGILTSIVNHGISNKYAKYADRIIMAISGILYIYYSIQIKDDVSRITSIAIVIIMSILYFFSKYIKHYAKNTILSSKIHMITHCLSVIPFYIIITNNIESDSILSLNKYINPLLVEIPIFVVFQ
jgi:hypothetical protein